MNTNSNNGVPAPPKIGVVPNDYTSASLTDVPNVIPASNELDNHTHTRLPKTPDSPSESILEAPSDVSDPAEALNSELKDETRVVSTGDAEHGLDKCPKCGSSEIFYDIETEALVCSFCRFSWNKDLAESKFGFDGAIRNLKGTKIGSGADVISDESTITIKCQGCAAEVIIQSDNNVSARCHWCRQTLSLNSRVPNGAVPDMVLPFSVNKLKAVSNITEFVDERKGFALKKFKDEFVPENVVGVYMPYMVIDANLTAEFTGEAEILTRKYTVRVGTGDNARNEDRYDADVYKIARRFDAHIDDLITESNSERRDFTGVVNTNNVINAILPFDVKNSVTYSSKYLTGFTSEKRNMDVQNMGVDVHEQLLSVTRERATGLSRQYDRGVKWETEGADIHGSQWVAVYVPVWLYSYYVPNSSKPGDGVVHYIAVNGRTGQTMGSVPISYPKLWAATMGTFTAVAAVCFPLAITAMVF